MPSFGLLNAPFIKARTFHEEILFLSRKFSYFSDPNKGVIPLFRETNPGNNANLVNLVHQSCISDWCISLGPHLAYDLLIPMHDS